MSVEVENAPGETGVAPGAVGWGTGRRGRAVLQLSVSLGMTVLLGAWALRGARWSEAWQSLRAAQWGWMVPHLVLLTLVHVLRALRYGCLLSRMERLPFRHLNEVMAVGNLFTVLMPLRLGDLARPLLVARRSRIPASAALASVTLERTLDVLALAVLLEATLPFAPREAPGLGYLQAASHILLAASAALLLLLVLLGRAETWVVGLVRALSGRVLRGRAGGAVRLVEQFVGALRVLPGPRAVMAAVVLTALQWLGYALALWVLAPAFAAEEGLRLGLLEACVLIGVISMSGFIPAAPGQAGTFQAAARVALALFLPEAVVAGAGLVYVNVVWLTGTLHLLALGAVFMVAGSVSAREVGLGSRAATVEPRGAAPIG